MLPPCVPGVPTDALRTARDQVPAERRDDVEEAVTCFARDPPPTLRLGRALERAEADDGTR